VGAPLEKTRQWLQTESRRRITKRLVVLVTFLIANIPVSGPVFLDQHVVAALALVLLCSVALWSAVLVVLRITARRAEIVAQGARGTPTGGSG